MKTIVVAPHPDDELFGVGGTLMRRKAEGDNIAWLIVTGISTEYGWNPDQVKKRYDEIKRISGYFSFDEVYSLNLRPAQVDRLPMSELVTKISEVLQSFEPQEVFVPHPSDVHTDHRVVFRAVAACTKWFRCPSVRRVLAYETLSETDFGLGVDQGFRPNYFVNIQEFLDRKLEAMAVYESELSEFPFPRSYEALRALAALRGTTSGFKAAEAFQLLRERL